MRDDDSPSLNTNVQIAQTDDQEALMTTINEAMA